ncbi:hypothetical protein DEQ92_14130 [Haloferax sp. Atlit-6N]|nr:hypothetical protein DEQ92_14130 [Haloferax sp. Atlit-6N]
MPSVNLTLSVGVLCASPIDTDALLKPSEPDSCRVLNIEGEFSKISPMVVVAVRVRCKTVRTLICRGRLNSGRDGQHDS